MSRTIVQRNLAATRTIKSPRRPRNPTGPTPPIISAIVAVAVDGTTEDISWNLDQYCTGYVQYGITNAYGSETTHEDSFNYNQHIQRITGLIAGTQYHFRVRSTNASGQETISGDSTFITTGSSSGPIISNIVVSNITSSGANVAWDTNIPSTGYVEYGLTTSYGAQSLTDSVLSTHHNLACTPLNAAGTIYHYKIHTFDNLGNPSTSTDATFTSALVGGYGIRPAPADLASFVYLPSASWTPTTGVISTVPVVDPTTGCTQADFDTWFSGIPAGTINSPRIIVWPAGHTWTRLNRINMDNHNYTIFWGYPAAGQTTGHARIHSTGTGSLGASATGSCHIQMNGGNNYKFLGLELSGINAQGGTINAFYDCIGNTTGTGEGGHGFTMGGNPAPQHVEIADCWVHNTHGASVAGYSPPTPKFINVHHNLLEKDGEQTITFSSGQDVWIQFNILRDCDGCAFDSEDLPGTTAYWLRLHFEDNWIDGWQWAVRGNQNFNWPSPPAVVTGVNNQTAWAMTHAPGQIGSISYVYNLRNKYTRGPMGWGQHYPYNVGGVSWDGTLYHGMMTEAVTDGYGSGLPRDHCYHENNDFSGMYDFNRVGVSAISMSGCTIGSIKNNILPGGHITDRGGNSQVDETGNIT